MFMKEKKVRGQISFGKGEYFIPLLEIHNVTQHIKNIAISGKKENLKA